VVANLAPTNSVPSVRFSSAEFARCCWLSAAAAAIDAELGDASREWRQLAN